MSGVLHGAGVLVTRPARQASALVQQIAALGGRPLAFPAIVITPAVDESALRQAQADLARYDRAIFVSANAVEFGIGDPAAWPAHLVAFAPGPGTAAALAAVGVRNVRIPATTMDSEGLLALPELLDVAGLRVAIFRGEGGRELLATTLSARGAHVVQIDCYRRSRPATSPAGVIDAWRAGRLDAVTLSSSEGLDNLWAIFGAEGRAYLAATPAFVPHRAIAEHASALGLRSVIVTPPADAGLLASLLEYFASNRPPS